MKKFLTKIVLLIFLILTASCTHTQYNSNAKLVNATITNEQIRVFLNDGKRYSGNRARITGDSLSWVDVTTNRTYTVTVSEIRKIVIVKPGMMIATSLVGLFSGAYFGSQIGSKYGDDPNKDIIVIFTKNDTAAIGGVFGGVLGAAIGLSAAILLDIGSTIIDFNE